MTIYYPDGTFDVVFSAPDKLAEQTQQIERILRERLGNDIADWLRKILCRYEDLHSLQQQEFLSYEQSADGYRACLQTVYEELETAYSELMNAKRLNRDKVAEVLQRQMREINQIL